MLLEPPLNIGHPHKNPRSLSRTKAEICPKITILEKFQEVWFGKFIKRKYRTVKEDIKVIHAKPPPLYQVPKL